MTAEEKALMGKLVHELATIVTPIVGYAELVERDVQHIATAAEKCREALDALRVAIREAKVTG